MPSLCCDIRYARAFKMACVVLMFLGGVLGAATNRTIDDQLGDPATGEIPVYFRAQFGHWAASVPVATQNLILHRCTTTVSRIDIFQAIIILIPSSPA
jgi:hypothetical protein